MRIITSEIDIQDGIAAIVEADPALVPVLALAGMPPLRRSTGGFEGLVGIIVAQQLSVASANAILARVKTSMTPLEPATFLTADDASLRACGLSSPKIRTLRAISMAIESEALPIESFGQMSADAAHVSLTRVKGIGPWTADIYLMFCLGHADAFAAGDLALQEAARIAYSLPERPSEKALHEIAENWRPWRAVAARLLWAYYREVKNREGVT